MTGVDARQDPDLGAALAAELVDAEEPFHPAPTPTSSTLGRVVLAASLILVSLNLRPLFSSLATVMPEIRRATDASPTVASVLTTTPVLCLGLFAATAPRLARRFGSERVILALLLLLAVGTALRGLGTIPALLFGSILAGGAVAVVNVNGRYLIQKLSRKKIQTAILAHQNLSVVRWVVADDDLMSVTFLPRWKMVAIRSTSTLNSVTKLIA